MPVLTRICIASRNGDRRPRIFGLSSETREGAQLAHGPRRRSAHYATASRTGWGIVDRPFDASNDPVKPDILRLRIQPLLQ